MKKNHFGTKGITLLEIMVVIAIIGILASIAVTSFHGMQARSKVRDAVDHFVADFYLARAKAQAEGERVVVVLTDANQPAQDFNGDGETEHYLVFIDKDKNNQFSQGDIVIASYRFKGGTYIKEIKGNLPTYNNNAKYLSFGALGEIESGGTGDPSICIENTNYKKQIKIVGLTGMIGIENKCD